MIFILVISLALGITVGATNHTAEDATGNILNCHEYDYAAKRWPTVWPNAHRFSDVLRSIRPLDGTILGTEKQRVNICLRTDAAYKFSLKSSNLANVDTVEEAVVHVVCNLNRYWPNDNFTIFLHHNESRREPCDILVHVSDEERKMDEYAENYDFQTINVRRRFNVRYFMYILARSFLRAAGFEVNKRVKLTVHLMKKLDCTDHIINNGTDVEELATLVENSYDYISAVDERHMQVLEEKNKRALFYRYRGAQFLPGLAFIDGKRLPPPLATSGSTVPTTTPAASASSPFYKYSGVERYNVNIHGFPIIDGHYLYRDNSTTTSTAATTETTTAAHTSTTSATASATTETETTGPHVVDNSTDEVAMSLTMFDEEEMQRERLAHLVYRDMGSWEVNDTHENNFIAWFSRHECTDLFDGTPTCHIAQLYLMGTSLFLIFIIILIILIYAKMRRHHKLQGQQNVEYQKMLQKKECELCHSREYLQPTY